MGKQTAATTDLARDLCRGVLEQVVGLDAYAIPAGPRAGKRALSRARRCTRRGLLEV